MTKPHDIFAIRRQISKLGAHFEGEDEPSAVLTWRPQGFARFESLWSIAHKIAHLNHVAATSLFRVIGRGPRLTRPWANVGLSSLENFDVPRMARLLGIPVNAIKLSVPGAYSLPSSGDVANARSHSLRYCPVCIGCGFHSPIYQYLHLTRCPIHREQLIDVCPSCKFPIIDTLANRALLNPYGCPCGYILWPDRNRSHWEPGISRSEEQILWRYYRWTRQLAKHEELLMRDMAFDGYRTPENWNIAAYWSEFHPLPGWPADCLQRDEKEIRGEAVCGIPNVPEIERTIANRKTRVFPSAFRPGDTYQVDVPADSWRSNALARQIQPALVATYKSIRRKLRQTLKDHESCIRVVLVSGYVDREWSCPWANSLQIWKNVWSTSLWHLRYCTEDHADHWVNRTLDEIAHRTRAVARKSGPELQLFKWVVQRLIAQTMFSSFSAIAAREVFPHEKGYFYDRDFFVSDEVHRPYFLWTPECARRATTIYWWSRPILPELRDVSRSDSAHRRNFRKFGAVRLRVLRDYINQLRH